MYIKTSALAIALLQVAVFVEAAKKPAKTSSTLDKPQDYWKQFKSLVDPNNITIPAITQTTSYDPTQECKYYQPPTNFVFNEKEWPKLWEVATSNGMTKTAEFQALNKSIEWHKMPKIKVRKSTAEGGLDMTSYPDSDPDCWWSSSTCTKPKHENINEDIYTCPEPETWGLTYDDGPNCSHNAFYDYLEENKIKASMFYIGSNVVNWPYGAQRGVKAGHHIADHTWSHALMTTLTNDEVLAELYYTQKAIKMVTGVTPLHWRPAFGDVDDRVRWIATQLNLTTVLWDLDTDDWAAGSSKTLEQVKATYDDYVTMGTNGTFANSGQIVLTHEIDNTTMDLALEYLPKIKTAYKNILDVATCMNITYPYQEKTVSFAPFGAASNVSTETTPAVASSAAAANPVAEAGTTTIPLAANKAKLTSAGIQMNPTNLIFGAFVAAAYFF
ncbi:chitin deacetylase [Sporodiniella umbellata]|nr:chitin deacetylase [Sporodiniella umbellata]